MSCKQVAEEIRGFHPGHARRSCQGSPCRHPARNAAGRVAGPADSELVVLRVLRSPGDRTGSGKSGQAKLRVTATASTVRFRPQEPTVSRWSPAVTTTRQTTYTKPHRSRQAYTARRDVIRLYATKRARRLHDPWCQGCIPVNSATAQQEA